MLTIEKLKNYGAEVEKGIARCGNNEQLYLRLVNIVIDELASDALGEALREADLDKAFHIAHKLKGGVSNVALTPVEGPVSVLTEMLRSKTPGDYGKQYDEIVKETERLTAIAR